MEHGFRLLCTGNVSSNLNYWQRQHLSLHLYSQFIDWLGFLGHVLGNVTEDTPEIRVAFTNCRLLTTSVQKPVLLPSELGIKHQESPIFIISIYFVRNIWVAVWCKFQFDWWPPIGTSQSLYCSISQIWYSGIRDISLSKYTHAYIYWSNVLNCRQ